MKSELKYCSKCNMIMEKHKFYKNITTKDGLSIWCTDCSFRYAREKKWGIMRDVEVKYIKPCMICGAPITEEQDEDNGEICDICIYDMEAYDEWRFLNAH